jgi:competence protein ComEC
MMTRPAGRSGRSNRHPRLFSFLVLTTLIVSAVLLALAIYDRQTTSSTTGEIGDGDVLATFAVLDVGQALSAAVVTADGESLVYDFGLSRDNVEQTIIPFLEEHGVSEINYAVLSHPHQDHVGGLPTLLEAIPIGHYIDPALETTNQTYLRSLEMVDALGMRASLARRGDEYQLGEHVWFEILWPIDELLTASDGSHLLNDNSTVVRVVVDEIEILLTGDIETNAEHMLVEDYGSDLTVDILQIAHHGSNTSSKDAFLEVARPEIGIIPVGADNRYGHPHREVVQRLRQHEVTIYRTDVDGTVIVTTDGKQFQVTTTRSGQSWLRQGFAPHWITLKPTITAPGSRFWFSTMVSN